MKGLLVLTGLILAGTITFSAIGSGNIENQESFTLEEMLTYSIEDELMAKAEYEKIIENLGVGRPFINIVKAEEKHIEYLQPLLIKYEVEYPRIPEEITIPETLQEAYRAGVDAEIANIDMYNKFLSEDIPEDVRETFMRLRDASKNHLRAFERQVARYE